MAKMITTGVVLCWLSGALIAQPAITFENEKIDFGQIDEGQKLNLEFKFSNTGNRTLVIRNIRASCGCTATRLDKREYQRGEGGSIKVIFNSSGFGGRPVTKLITVSTNDPKTPYTRLSISGKVILKDYAKIGIYPEAISFGKVQKGEEEWRTVTIRNTGTVDLKIIEFGHSPEIFPEIETPSIEPNSSVKIKIRLRPASIGPFSTFLKIRSNSHREYMKVIKITAKVTR